jgi:acid phosphatase type 7
MSVQAAAHDYCELRLYCDLAMQVWGRTRSTNNLRYIMKNRFPVFLLTAAFVFIYSASFSLFDNRSIDENLNATEKPDHIVLTWSDDPATTQTISWRGAQTVTDGCVEYGEAGGAPSDKAVVKARVELFTTLSHDRAGKMNIFSATLRKLRPGTRYSYRVANGSVYSPRYAFMTAAGNSETTEFLVFGDSQSGNYKNPDYSQWHDTLSKAVALNAKARFFVNMGDLVEIGQNYIHWDNWFDAAKDVLCAIPIVPVEGNHETYTLRRKFFSRPAYFASQFKTFQNGPEGLKGQVYSFDYGSAHFSILDSQQEEETPGNDRMLKAQESWLDKDLAASGKKWRLVFFHKTPYSHNPLNMDHSIKEAFCPIIEKYHVDVVFNGHDHVLARTKPLKNDKSYDDPKVGTVYYTTGRSGAKYYQIMMSTSMDTFFYNPTDQPCYEAVTVAVESLRIAARKQDGSLIDEYTIKK